MIVHNHSVKQCCPDDKEAESENHIQAVAHFGSPHQPVLSHRTIQLDSFKCLACQPSLKFASNYNKTVNTLGSQESDEEKSWNEACYHIQLLSGRLVKQSLDKKLNYWQHPLSVDTKPNLTTTLTGKRVKFINHSLMDKQIPHNCSVHSWTLSWAGCIF